MPSINLVTYASGNYKAPRQSLVDHCKSKNLFDSYFSFSRDDIESSEFYKPNKVVLDIARGDGAWCWKPFIILNTLLKLSYGDIVLYVDSGDWVVDFGIREFIDRKMQGMDSLFTIGGLKNSNYCKRDCFVLMGCDSEKYWSAPQLEAGIVVVKKTFASLAVVSAWLDFCCNYNIVSDATNVCGLPNLDGFIDHRHDQAVITNIYVKNALYASNEMREFIVCNWQPV